jgi:hypothetical protein
MREPNGSSTGFRSTHPSGGFLFRKRMRSPTFPFSLPPRPNARSGNNVAFPCSVSDRQGLFGLSVFVPHRRPNSLSVHAQSDHWVYARRTPRG